MFVLLMLHFLVGKWNSDRNRGLFGIERYVTVFPDKNIGNNTEWTFQDLITCKAVRFY